MKLGDIRWSDHVVGKLQVDEVTTTIPLTHIKLTDWELSQDEYIFEIYDLYSSKTQSLGSDPSLYHSRCLLLILI